MSMWTKVWHELKAYAEGIVEFFFPRYCVACGEQLSYHQHHLCTSCLMHLPRTMFHTVPHSYMETLFWGKVVVERAVSFFYYNDIYREIFIQLKYKDNPDIGQYIANQYAKEIIDSGFFTGIDLIIPLPLHPRRKRHRGYNQSEFIGRGIHEVTGIPICCNAVERAVNNVSQTRLDHRDRRRNVEGIFSLVRPQLIEGKHVLLVDDVTTTGSTLASCIGELLKAQNTKVSVLTIAMAAQTRVLTVDDNNPLMPSIPIDVEALSKLQIIPSS